MRMPDNVGCDWREQRMQVWRLWVKISRRFKMRDNQLLTQLSRGGGNEIGCYSPIRHHR